MQTANIMLALGGDQGNQIPKPNVTAAEIAVLIAIHGEAAVQDIEPLGDKPVVDIDGNMVRWTNRVELDRLRRTYGRAKNTEDQSHVDVLFPGAAARVFETIDELNLPQDFFKPTARAAVPVAPEPVAAPVAAPVAETKRRGRKATVEAAPEPAAEESEAPVDDAPEISSDGIDDMPDGASESAPAGENLFG